MSLHSQDWINIAIATGTSIAAIASCFAARGARRAAEQSEQQNERNAHGERTRWLTSTLIGMAESCNTVVLEHGILSGEQANLSKMITTIHHAIEMIEDHDIDSEKTKKYLWYFLHTSIRAELISREQLKRWSPEDTQMLFPDSERIYNTLTKQYDFVETGLVNVVNSSS